MDQPKPFIMPLQIQLADIDQLGHVNNVVYLRWVQWVAEAHWLQLNGPVRFANGIWVVQRHEIDYLAPAYITDKLEAHTWVAAAQGIRSPRLVEIRKVDGRLCAVAKTYWCWINPENGKPQRLPSDLQAFLQKS